MGAWREEGEGGGGRSLGGDTVGGGRMRAVSVVGQLMDNNDDVLLVDFVML